MITFAEYVNQEADVIWRDVTEKHRNESLVKLERFAAFAGYGERPLDSFKPKDIHRFQEHLSVSGLTRNTINHYNTAIKSVFRHALKSEFIEREPQFNWFKVNRSGHGRVFTEVEIKKTESFLRKTNNPWVADLFVIGLNTGMRLGEILKIGTDEGRLETIDGSTYIRLVSTKNGDNRMVPVNDRALSAINALGGKPKDKYSHRTFYDTWIRARYRVAPGDKSFKFHACRNTAITVMAERGVQPLTVAKMVGHRSMTTTLGYYKASTSGLKDASDQLNL